MKAAREHIVPLSDSAIALLGARPMRASVSRRASRPTPVEMAMLELVRGMIGNGYTVHGFRSTFRDWCREQTNFPRELAELTLAHVNKDKTEAAYARGAAVERRRQLMDEWAEFCASAITD